MLTEQRFEGRIVGLGSTSGVRVDLGTPTRVEPPVRFGFDSTPRQPVVTSLVTTIRRQLNSDCPT